MFGDPVIIQGWLTVKTVDNQTNGTVLTMTHDRAQHCIEIIII